MKILFDAYGQQIVTQVQTGTRLTGLFACLDAAQYSYDIASDQEPLNKTLSNEYNVLVLTTRMTVPYTVAELNAITNFVVNGGGLWCMANHAGFNLSGINNNHTRYTGSVCSTFWSALEAAAYSSNTNTSEVDLTEGNLTSHPTIVGQEGWPLADGSNSMLVSKIATRSFCGVYQNAFSENIAGLDNLPNVWNVQSKKPVTQGVQWAIGLSNPNSVGKGRVVICGDSGWIADTTSNYPGPGEFQNGDNAQYTLNTLSWLANIE